MNLLEKHDQLLREKISTLDKGTEAGLVAIFGDDWEKNWIFWQTKRIWPTIQGRRLK